MTVVVSSDGSDNSVVKLFDQLSSQRVWVTNDLWETLLVKVGPRLLGVLNISA